ncbi:MAG TPA: hypothetical protein VEP30_11910 [Chthoniobacterales bacterium]|nr:hypothetical protein [Chthoniobacterales bacterium]
MKVRLFLSALIGLGLAGCGGGGSGVTEWNPEAAMDHQFFPSLIIATASVRPVEDEDEEAKEPDPYLLGDKFGLLGVSIKTPSRNADVKVTIKENDLITATTWTGKLAEANHDYYIAPKVNYKFDHLRKVTQQIPMNIDFEVEVNGKSLGDKTETLQIRSINDCPYGVANSEETVDDENVQNGSADLGWMFAAYVNENHPQLDKILQEALATKIVDSFDGYQANDPTDVVKQVFAIWAVLQKHGIQYSSVTETPGGSPLVRSQFVRFLDQSIAMTQANCVDGTVLFASLLRKVGINPVLVAKPDHMYVAFNLNESDNEDESELIGLETTDIGASEIEQSNSEPPVALTNLEEQLSDRVGSSKAWRSFFAAVLDGEDDLDKNDEKFDAGDPDWQIINIAEAREKGIMPISFEAAR